MAIISWTDVLDSLLLAVNRSAPEMKDDLLQLIGFCNEIENSSFIPFKAEDLGSDIAKSIDRYYMVIDSVTQLLLNHKEYPASKKGLRATPLWNGYAQYLKIRQIPIGVVFYRELWKKATSVETPFWVSLHNEKWQQDDNVYKYYSTLPAQMVDRNHDGVTYIALKTPIGLTLEETAKVLADQVLCQVNAFYDFLDKNITLSELQQMY